MSGSSVAASDAAPADKPPDEGEADTGDLSKAVQNPVADLISVPFQNNTSYNIGANERASNTLNIQPVIPLHITESINLISRIIMPVTYQPDLNATSGGTSAFGDTSASFFLSPAKPGKLIWGVGPAFLLPTATQRAVGTGKWSVGPTAVGLVQPGHWTFGAVASQVWSFAGPSERSSVSLMVAQYFVTYQLAHAWYVTSSPILTFDWKAPSSEEWLVPFGGGIGKIFKLGKLPLNGTVQGYYNVRPSDSTTIGNWQARVQLAFLFPTAKPKAAPQQAPEQSAQAAAPSARSAALLAPSQH